MFKRILVLLLVFLASFSKTYATFDFNATCKQALDAIFDLRLDEARALVAKEKRANPKNGISIYLENYIDYFSIMTSDNKADFERLKNVKSSRISALEQLDKNSPYYNFVQAEINLQSGLLKSKFQEFLGSGMDMKRAHSLLTANAKKFPDFLPNKKSLGLIDVVFGSIPSNLKGVFSAVGIRGNVNTGIKTLESLMVTLPKSPFAFFKDEVVFFLSFIETDLVLNKANYNRTIQFTNGMGAESLLKSYLQGYVSLRNGQNDKAIEYLSKRPTGDRYADFPAFYYLLGNAKLQRGDADANAWFIKYIQEYKGSSYVKDAYLKLAYFHLMRGERDKYQGYLNLVQSKGNTSDEKDKQALKEAKEQAPDIDLLKARFLFDGGYYNKALVQLNNKNLKDFKLNRDHIELYYRLGRIYDEQGRDSLALTNYQKAIQIGKDATYYYAANAALFSGQIYEKLKNASKAVTYYKQAVDMKNHEYEKSIENKAKAGLKRMGQ